MRFVRTVRLSLAIVSAALLGGAGPALFSPLPEDIATRCLETELKSCEIQGYGVVTVWGGYPVAYQVQHGFTGEDGVLGGIVLFEERDGGWHLIASDFSGASYEPPRMTEAELVMLHAPGVVGGTGSYNADLLLVRDPEPDTAPWRAVDLDSWRETVVPLLPEGLEIWKGVDFDFGDWFYGALDARTYLWRGDDANCCPTGGQATIAFEIVDDVLVPVSVDYRPPRDDD